MAPLSGRGAVKISAVLRAGINTDSFLHGAFSSFRDASLCERTGIQKRIPRLHLDSGFSPSVSPGMTVWFVIAGLVPAIALRGAVRS